MFETNMVTTAMAPPCEAKLIPTLGRQLRSRKCHFAPERVPFCEQAQDMAKRPPSLRMPSISLEGFSGPLHRRLFLALSQQILASDFQKWRSTAVYSCACKSVRNLS